MRIDRLGASGLTAYGRSPGSSYISPPGLPEDILVRLSRMLLYAGLAGSSVLVPRVGDITIGDAMLGASTALLVCSMARTPRPAPCQWLRWSAFHLTVIGGIVALIGTGFAPPAASVLLRVVFVAFVLPWVIREVLADAKYFRRAVLAFVAGAALTGYGCLLQLFAGSTIIPQAEVTNAGRYSGFTGHVSDTGGITSLAVIAGVVLFMKAVGPLHVVVSMIILTGGLAGLLLSGSVSGMLVAAVFGALALLMIRSPLRRWVALISGGVSVLVVISAIPNSRSRSLGPVERFKQVVGLTDGNDPTTNTFESRWTTITSGWHGFLNNPLRGHGLDPDSAAVIGGLPPHNFWVDALYQGGLIFTVGLTITVVTSCYVGFRTLRVSVPASVAALTAWGAVFFSLTAPSFYNRYLWVPLALAACAGARAWLGSNASLSSKVRAPSKREIIVSERTS
jgi:hypothetical protein